jgi:hypothetical protein
MQAEPLYVFAKNRIIDEPSADEQRELLKALIRASRPKSAGEGESATVTLPHADYDFPDRLYSAGKLLPRAYCYLAFCLKVLEISTKGQRDRSQTARLWSYVLWSTLSSDELAGFVQALQADTARLRDQYGRLPQVLENMEKGEAELSTHPLKHVASSMMRALIWDDDRYGLRELVQWTYSAYEPRWKLLLNESHDFDQWLTNVAELLPRLLLKNIVPLHDSVAVRDSRVVIAEYASAGSPHGLHDPGLVTRRTSFIRSLFTETEIQTLEKVGQRMSELFAHAYPLLLIDDPKRELAELRERILDTARSAGRIKVMQHIETQYRYNLRIPTWLYRELKNEIIRIGTPLEG